MNRKMLILTIIVVAIAIPVGVYTFFLLFINMRAAAQINSTVNEQADNLIQNKQQQKIK